MTNFAKKNKNSKKKTFKKSLNFQYLTIFGKRHFSTPVRNTEDVSVPLGNPDKFNEIQIIQHRTGADEYELLVTLNGKKRSKKPITNVAILPIVTAAFPPSKHAKSLEIVSAREVSEDVCGSSGR